MHAREEERRGATHGSPTFTPACFFVDTGSPWIPRQSWSTWPTWPPSREGEQDPRVASRGSEPCSPHAPVPPLTSGPGEVQRQSSWHQSLWQASGPWMALGPAYPPASRQSWLPSAGRGERLGGGEVGVRQRQTPGMCQAILGSAASPWGWGGEAHLRPGSPGGEHHPGGGVGLSLRQPCLGCPHGPREGRSSLLTSVGRGSSLGSLTPAAS